MEKKMKFTTPKVPNFIIVENTHAKEGEFSVSVAEFSDEEIYEIGVEWTNKLLERAKEIRKSQKTSL